MTLQLMPETNLLYRIVANRVRGQANGEIALCRKRDIKKQWRASISGVCAVRSPAGWMDFHVHTSSVWRIAGRIYLWRAYKLVYGWLWRNDHRVFRASDIPQISSLDTESAKHTDWCKFNSCCFYSLKKYCRKILHCKYSPDKVILRVYITQSTFLKENTHVKCKI